MKNFRRAKKVGESVRIVRACLKPSWRAQAEGRQETVVIPDKRGASRNPGWIPLSRESGDWTFFPVFRRLFGCCERGLCRAVTKQGFRWRNALTRHEACV